MRANPTADPPAEVRSIPLPAERRLRDSVSVAIDGSGGAGVMTAGTMLLDAAARAGLYGLMVRTSGPQIRGGEAAALLRLSHRPVQALDDHVDLLLAMDWQNVHRFADEIPLRADSLVLCDSGEGDAPEAFTRGGARQVALPLKKMAKAIAGSWGKMGAAVLAAQSDDCAMPVGALTGLCAALDPPLPNSEARLHPVPTQ